MSRNRINTLCVRALTIGVTLMLVAAPALTDPLPGRDLLKFSQLPMDGTQIPSDDGTVGQFWGHDELSTAYSETDPIGQTVYRGRFMADDFADGFSTPVVHVKWWGSYLNNLLLPDQPVDKFLISFEEDVPGGPAPDFSHPGTPLLNQIVRRGPLAPGSGTFTENPISPGGDPLNERLYEYNAELHLGKEFPQKPDTVYWLKIVAMIDLPPGVIPGVDPTTQWGWHNRDYTVNDPLASVAPQVVPGEDVVGFVGPAATPTPVWHFQDDAVTGDLTIDTLSTPDGAIMPLVDQDELSFLPTLYNGMTDGPQNIGSFSKDLAFELYTIGVPEPASALLMGIGLALVGLRFGRGQRARRGGHGDGDVLG